MCFGEVQVYNVTDNYNAEYFTNMQHCIKTDLISYRSENCQDLSPVILLQVNLNSFS